MQQGRPFRGRGKETTSQQSEKSIEKIPANHQLADGAINNCGNRGGSPESDLGEGEVGGSTTPLTEVSWVIDWLQAVPGHN